MKSWVKLYTEINRDPKLLTLTWAQRGIWAALLAMAGEIDDRNEAGLETGILDTVEYTALRIRCDATEFQEAIAAFTERGMIDNIDGILFLPKYTERQARAPSARRAAVASRVRKHRSETAECNEDVTTLQRGVTPSDSDSDTETERESEPFCLTTSDDFSSTNPAPPPARIKSKAWPESVMAFKEETGHAPPNSACYDAIVNTVTLDAASISLWHEIMRAWMLQGWKWQNVAGMLDHYRDKRIPGQRNNGGPSPPPSQPQPTVIYGLDAEPDWLGVPDGNAKPA